MASGWRPGSVAWGITAMYLLVAVELTSLAKRRLPKKIWRAVHLLSFVLFVFSTVHAIQSGTDLANPVVRVVGIGLITLAVAAAGLRIARTRHVVGPAPAPSTVAAVGATAERPPAMSSMR
jgi:DMSO/TMAO reductase YedYZ heme-binding membrane subunit